MSNHVAEKTSWAEAPERAAGRWRIAFMFLFLRLFGRLPAKCLTFFIVLFAYPFLPRRRFRLYLNFAFSLVDKSAACAGFGRPPRFTFTGDTAWIDGNACLLSTHVGCIEVLPAAREGEGQRCSGALGQEGEGQRCSGALGQEGSENSTKPSSPNPLAKRTPNPLAKRTPNPLAKRTPKAPKVHAFQQMSHNAVFTEIFEKHIDPERLTLHAVESIDVGTMMEMQDAVERGEIVLMAADRDSAQSGKRGVFRFAKLLGCPVYAITCIADGWNAYIVDAKRLDIAALEADYNAFLSAAIAAHPDQWYEFGGN